MAALAAEGWEVPGDVAREFEEYLRRGRLEWGFLRVRCEVCHRERLVAFSCKRRGICPSSGAPRMVDTAALLVNNILPEVPIRQWVVSPPYALRFLFATRSAVVGEVLGIVCRVIAGHLVKKAGETQASARTGAVTLIQRFGSAPNANIHLHTLFLDGVCVEAGERLRFRRVKAPERAELEALLQSLSERVGRHLERQGLLERMPRTAISRSSRKARTPWQRCWGTP